MKSNIPAELLDILKQYDGEGTRILELGSSGGRHTHGFKGNVHVIDLDADKLEQSKLSGNHPTILLHDLADIPLPVEGRFDIILCLEVLEHLERSKAIALLSAIETLSRGVVILSTPNVTNYTQLIRFLLCRQLIYYGSFTLIEKIIYFLINGRLFDGKTALKTAQQTDRTTDLDRHKTGFNLFFFKERGYIVSGGASDYIYTKFPFFERFKIFITKLLRNPHVSGTVWAHKFFRSSKEHPCRPKLN